MACGKQFETKFHLEEHNKDEHEHSYITCAACGKQFETKSPLEEHNKNEHSEITCAACGKQFETTSQLENHSMDTHNNLGTAGLGDNSFGGGCVGHDMGVEWKIMSLWEAPQSVGVEEKD